MVSFSLADSSGSEQWGRDQAGREKRREIPGSQIRQTVGLLYMREQMKPGGPEAKCGQDHIGNEEQVQQDEGRERSKESVL